MIKKSFIYFLAFAFCFLALPVLEAQVIQEKKMADKVIVDGKTFYLYKVKKGEGFYGIAKRYGVSQKEIHEANPNSIFGLNPGDILYIPVIEGRNSNILEINESDDFIYHTVQKGQTLYYLSKKYEIPIDSIKKYNAGLDKELLVGAILKIPAQQPVSAKENKDFNFIYHQVNPKETLYGIAKQYQTRVDSLLKYNKALQSGILAVGSKVRIPIHKKQDKVIMPQVPQVDIPLEDDEFFYHRIQRGETIYSVSKKYRVSQNNLENANPDLDPAHLPLGFVVKIPKDVVKSKQLAQIPSSNDIIIHTVKRKETIYSIAKKYGVEIADIQEANPDVILTNIKRRSEIKVPTPEYLVRVKQQKQLLNIKISDSIPEIIDRDTLGIPCKGYNYYADRQVISVALLLPFDMEATYKHNLIKSMEGEEEILTERSEPVLSPRSRTFVEFYQGVLIAVDSLKKQGVNIRLHTFDTAPDTNRVKQILALPQLKTVDLIIGPAYASNLNLVSDFSLKNQIKMVYPLSNVNNCLNTNPYLFQVNAEDTLLYHRYSDFIVKQQMGNRIVVIKSAVPNDNENKLASEIKNKLYLKYLPLGRVPDFLEISFSEHNVQGLEALLSRDKLNVVVIPSPGEADVSKIITTLHGVSESSDVRVKLIGFGNWLRFQTINAEEVHDLDTHILTPYVLDHNNTRVSRFSSKYRAWYHTEPFAVSPYFIRSGQNARYSRYGIWGFDVAYFFLDARVKYGKKFEYCINNLNPGQVQFNFHFQRYANWGGFYNDGLYVIRFSPSLEISRMPLN
ncbi:ABC-type branched-chain amino acid transport system, substrate-binding protein [Saccharicrinis carchari]|uniref:ABC-type branched-chain amino acid transport system, substrate-binding protein n=1 Tax=Saccharicrinis carchari TaxID=1168039 RepID=A0A521B2S7_SACCC|nr:LysM peptidoglycan-binding domain-containing protein [Saccharicrinis carchari]SMO41403.1 ABC-type branched-chain amino acid transport system, substrate-binding protein [Saccharicrinis carchari]